MQRANAQLVDAGPAAATSEPSTPLRTADSRGLAPLLRQMAPTTLAQLDAVSLLNRVDTKFLLPASFVMAALPALADDYLVLEIEGRRLHRYRTLYFDTPSLDLYRDHHAGRSERHKVRSRAYLDSGLSFFEIKCKVTRQRTVKHRLATPSFLTDLTAEALAFVSSDLPSEAHALRPTMQNDFVRVTLAGKGRAERLTLDLDIQFDCDGRTAILPRLAIAELKQSNTDHGSPFMQLMRSAQIRPIGISKYCVGVAMLVAGVRHDAFDDTLAAVEALTRADGARSAAAGAAAQPGTGTVGYHAAS